MKALKTPLLALAVLLSVATASTGLAAAKGGSTSGTVVPTTVGSCDAVTTTADNTFVAPLTNDNFPGTVAVTIELVTVPVAKSICLAPGWSVDYKQVTGGFQANFTYNGQRAIDFKFVLGKTDIRNY